MNNEWYNLLNNKIITKKFDQFDSYIYDLHNQIVDLSGNGTNGITIGHKINVNGFALDSPGVGTFYYTIWMSSSASHNYSDITAVLTVLKIQN